MKYKIEFTNEEKIKLANIVSICQDNMDDGSGNNKGNFKDQNYNYICRWNNGSYLIIQEIKTNERILEISLDYKTNWNLNVKKLENWFEAQKLMKGSE